MNFGPQSVENLGAEEKETTLFNPGFVILTVLFLLTAAAMAAFFQLQPYLASIRVNAAWIGFIIGADSLASFVIQPLCAPFLHPGNARRWMAIGITIMAVSLIAYTFGKSVLSLVLIRIAQGAGFVTFLAAMMAGIVAYIPPSRSGQGFGVLSLVRLVPYALVPPIVTYLVDHSIRFPMVLAGFAFITAFSLLLLFWVPAATTSPSGASPRCPGGPVGFQGAVQGLKDRRVRGLLLVTMLVFVCYTVVFFYISGFGKHAGLTGTSLFFTIATVMMVGVRFVGGMLFDRFDKVRLVSWCLFALAFSFLFIPYAENWSLYCLAGVFGLTWGIVMPLLNAMVFDISPPRLRGVNLNLALVAMQCGFFLGPIAGGFMVARCGYTVLFILCCPLTLVALGVLARGRAAAHELSFSSVGADSAPEET